MAAYSTEITDITWLAEAARQIEPAVLQTSLTTIAGRVLDIFPVIEGEESFMPGIRTDLIEGTYGLLATLRTVTVPGILDRSTEEDVAIDLINIYDVFQSVVSLRAQKVNLDRLNPDIYPDLSTASRSNVLRAAGFNAVKGADLFRKDPKFQDQRSLLGGTLAVVGCIPPVEYQLAVTAEIARMYPETTDEQGNTIPGNRVPNELITSGEVTEFGKPGIWIRWAEPDSLTSVD